MRHLSSWRTLVDPSISEHSTGVRTPALEQCVGWPRFGKALQGVPGAKGAMMARLKVNISPDRREGGWKIEGGGGREGFRTKDQAVRAGKTRAKAAELGQLIVKGRDGKIQTEYTYGKDPRRTKG